MIDGEIVWSDDGDRWETELSDLLDSPFLEVGDPVLYGEVVTVKTEDLNDSIDYILDYLGEAAVNKVGYAAEDYPEVGDEAKAELQTFLTDWINKHCPPRFFMVEKIESRLLIESDFQNATG